jgi:hypothetical protein
MRVSGNRSSLLVLVAALAVPLGACTAITGFNSFHGGGGGADAGLDAATSSDDGGPGFDAGPRPDTGGAMCTPACLADEDCCSGSCVDLLSDPDHCGECGMVCPDRDNSSPACDELGCDFDCEPGFDDCDAEDSNGCEQRLNTADACGSCDNSCSGATPICNGATGTCVGSCTGTEMECDGTCVDVMGSDVTHCGSCTNVCAMLAGATRTCARGTCQYACEGGRLDCDGDLGAMGSNGCESSETTYYADMDGDGYGAGAAMMGCLPATAASMRAGDCDDRNRDINPGAVETCNGVSDDCDARTDEGITFMGTAVGGSCSCALGSAPGIVTCATAATATCTYPAEVCNGLDDDCVAGADDGFACVRGASSTCTGTGSIAGCTFVGMQSCDATCSLSACTAPAETCDMMDQNCDGFVDEGALTLGPPVGGYADMTAGARFVAAAWRGASEGGAALVMVENPTTGDRELRFYFVDPSGAPSGGFFYRVSTGSALTGLGVNVPADLAWDGARWVVFFMHFVSGTGGEIRRVTITPEPGGSMSMPTTEAMGMSSVSAARSPTGDVGVVFGRFDEVRTGVWRAGAWARTPVASISGRTNLDYAQVTAIGGGGFMTLTSDTGGALPALLLQQFNAMSAGSIYAALTGTPRVDGRLAYHPPSGRVVLTWRDSPAGTPFAALWDPVAGSLYGSIIPLGAGNTPRVAAGLGDIFLAPGPDVRRLRSDGALYTESLSSSLYVDAILALPGSGSSAMTFSYEPSLGGPATRRIGCL